MVDADITTDPRNPTPSVCSLKYFGLPDLVSTIGSRPGSFMINAPPPPVRTFIRIHVLFFFCFLFFFSLDCGVFSYFGVCAYIIQSMSKPAGPISITPNVLKLFLDLAPGWSSLPSDSENNVQPCARPPMDGLTHSVVVFFPDINSIWYPVMWDPQARCRPFAFDPRRFSVCMVSRKSFEIAKMRK